MAEITINHEARTAYVNDFLGFTPDWDEIVLPYDREAVKALEAQGYSIEYAHDEI